MSADEDDDVKPEVQSLEWMQEREESSRLALEHQEESNRVLRQQLDELQKKLEEKENKLIEANEIIRVLRNEVQTLQQQLEREQRWPRTRAPHKFATFRIGLLLSPNMDKVHQQKETPRKVKVPMSLSSMEFYNFLRGLFPKLGNTDFQLVKADEHDRITALRVSPLTPSMLIDSGELGDSALYLLPKESLEELVEEAQEGSQGHVSASHLVTPVPSHSSSNGCEDEPADLSLSDDDAVRSSTPVTNGPSMTPGNTATAGQKKKAPRAFVTFRVGLLLDPHMNKLCPRKAEASRQISVPVSMSAKEFHNVLKGVFPRLGSTDFQLVKVDGHKSITALEVSPVTPSALKASGELKHSGLYILPKEFLRRQIGKPRKKNPDKPADPRVSLSCDAVRSSKPLTNGLRVTEDTATSGKKRRAPRAFVTFRVGLLLDPHMDKLCPRKAEASRRIRVPLSMSTKEFHNVLKGVFPRLGSTDFQLVKVDGHKSITALEVSPVTPSALKASGELKHSGLYILPKEYLSMQIGKPREKNPTRVKRMESRIEPTSTAPGCQDDADHNDSEFDRLESERSPPRSCKDEDVETPSVQQRPPSEPSCAFGRVTHVERMETHTETSSNAPECQDDADHNNSEFDRLETEGSPPRSCKDEDEVDIGSEGYVSPPNHIDSEFNRLEKQRSPTRSCKDEDVETPSAQQRPPSETSCAIGREGYVNPPNHNDSEFDRLETQSPTRSCKDEDVETPSTRQRPPSEPSCAFGNVGYVSPPNLFLLCTSEDDPADLPVSLGNRTVTSPKQDPLRLVTVKLQDCRGMLGPDGVFKVPTEKGNHDDKDSCGYDQHDDDGGDDDDDITDGDSDYNPSNEGQDSCSDDDEECSRTLSNTTTLRAHQECQSERTPLSSQCRRESKARRPKTSHKCRDCGECFPSTSRLLVHKKIHRKGKTGRRKTIPAKPLECGDCGKVFSFPSLLAIHQRTHLRKKLSSSSAERSYACTHCPNTFANSRNLYEHVRRQHKPKPVYQCSHCSETFEKASLWKIHRQGPCKEILDRDRNSHQCDECGKIVKSRTTLEQHKLIHTGERPHACTHCNKAFVLIKHLYDHLRKKHGQGPHKERKTEKRFQCDECGKLFSHQQNLIFHIRIHTGEKPHVCTVCDKAFTLPGNLRQHQRVHTQEKPYECTQCPKKCRSASHFKKHMRSHTGEKPYACTMCPKSFICLEYLKIHVRVHTDAKPYSCLQCGKCFRSTGALKTHEKTHGEEKPYPCPHCGRKFKTERTMKRHIPTHTGERPYKCSFCDKTFIGHAGRTKHERTHTGEKPYRCSVCGKAFAVQDALKTHQRVHSGEKPFQCNICGETFSYFQTLQSHQKREHGVGPSHKCSQCGDGFKTAKELRSHKCVQDENGRVEKEVEDAVNDLKTTQN